MDYETFVERYADVRSDPWVGSLGVYIPEMSNGVPPWGRAMWKSCTEGREDREGDGQGWFPHAFEILLHILAGGLAGAWHTDNSVYGRTLFHLQESCHTSRDHA